MGIAMRLGLVATLVLAAGVVVGCSDPMPEGLALGESAEVAGWKVTVESVEIYDEPDREPEAEGTVFLSADISIENTTDEEMWWDTMAVMSMEDAAGETYEEDGMIIPNQDAGELAMGSFSAGDGRGGLIAFEVAETAEGLVVVFTPEEMGEDEEPAKWAVGNVENLE